MKKLLLTSLAFFTIESQLNSSHSGGALAGGVIGGFAGGYLLARLIHRDDHKDPAYYSHKEKKMMKKEANKQLHIHKKSRDKHQKNLNRLETKKEGNTASAQHLREQIIHHEGIIARIEQEIREIFHEDTNPEKMKKTRKNNSNKK